MRPLGLLGLLLVAFGLFVLLLGGISYTKDREEVKVGPLEVAAERKGFIPPSVGVVALAAGLLLVFTGRRRSRS